VSATVLETTEQLNLLRSRAEQVEELVSSPRSPREQAVARGDEEVAARAERRLAWYGKVERCVLALSDALPQGLEDYDVRKLFEFLLQLRNAIENDPEGSDAAGEVELAKLRMGDVAHRIGRRLLHEQLDDPRTAADYVFATLRGVGVGDLARVLGVSTKTIYAWKAGRPVARNVRRVVTVAHILTYIHASMTPLGLVMWFDASRDQLAERTPLQLLDEDTERARPILVELARGARGQLAD
jgi:hypothetical protein